MVSTPADVTSAQQLFRIGDGAAPGSVTSGHGRCNPYRRSRPHPAVGSGRAGHHHQPRRVHLHAHRPGGRRGARERDPRQGPDQGRRVPAHRQRGVGGGDGADPRPTRRAAGRHRVLAVSRGRAGALRRRRHLARLPGDHRLPGDLARERPVRHPADHPGSGGRRRVPGPGRPLRMRQVHEPEDARRPRARGLGPGTHRRPRHDPRRAARPRRGHGVPELRPVPDHDRRAEHGLRAAQRRHQQVRHPEAGRRGRPDPPDRGTPGPQALTAVRRAAPARGHGAGDRAPTQGVLHGRTAVQPRRQTPGVHPRRDRRPAATPRRGSCTTAPSTRSWPGSSARPP